ncbi:MAG: NERD domain-containing protein [Oscillospiraceae bacterium]|nr:NERD domain-containing protein [Oscillospiraceae bacterium]
MQVFRNKNPYYRTLIFISAARIALCVLPIFVLCFLLWRIGSENYLETVGFTMMILGMVLAYAALSRRYRILLSGHNGERALFKIIKHIKWSGDCAVFTNLPVIYRKSRSEIDMLLIGERGIVIIEVKNHSGAIIGSGNDDFWLQRKKFREGYGAVRGAEKKMINPLIQLRRQRGIIKSLLREHGFDVWVENALFFSNPNVRLKLNLSKNNRAFSDKSDLVRFINDMKPEKPLTKRECKAIIGAIREMSAG